MTRILRRTLTSGAVSSVPRGIRRLFRKRVRALVIALVMSLLFSSLPVSSNTQTTALPQRSQPVATQLYSAVTQAVTSVGSWMASFIKTDPSSISTYQPVAAYLNPAPPFIDAPTNLTVTATASNSVNLSWTAPSGSVDHYVVERTEDIQVPFSFLANVTGATTKNDITVTNLHAYLYRVRAVSSTGAISVPSNMALGTAINFLLSNLGGQEIKAQHFHDVRTAINAVRSAAHMSAATWTRGTLTNLEVQANDVNEMRTALNAALTTLSIPVTAYDDPTLSGQPNGTLIKASHIEQLQTRSTRGSSTSSGPIDPDSSTARLDPLNETGGAGENPLSRNFNWNLPLLGLPGRAGLDLGLTLSYNSLVWTKIGANAISFDDDNGFPGPGFRLGFPVIQQRYVNNEVGTQAYLLISPDGSRTELRQVGTSNFYEAADSSHLVLDENTMMLRTIDGTQLSYVLHGGEFQCTQIKDRNGNFITVSYNAAGRINTITDTLNRVITFNYTNGWLMSITQSWKQHLQTPVTHYWARFEYTHTTPIDFNFGNMTAYGAADNSQITTLSKVTLADDSRFDFSYTSWGQVWKVTNFAADNSVLNYRTYDLPLTAALQHDDCPRFTVRKDWAKYWNGDTDGTTSTSEEVATLTVIVPVSDNWTMPDNTPASGVRAQVTTPDGTLNKFYYVGAAGTDSGWRRGLPALVETHSGGQWKRKVMTTWTQDDETNAYILNPRVKETNIHDPDGNRARREITYTQFSLGNNMNCHLPQDVFEYAADASTKLRTTRTLYNMTATYTSRRILGLVSDSELYEGAVNPSTLKSKVSFFYDNDNGSSSIEGTDAPVQHDNTNYTAGFVSGRGNLSSVKRFNVDNLAESTTTRTKYNTAGGVVSMKDASNHETIISYADSFSDGTPRNTLAYPTKVTDPDTFESTVKYDFDFGSITSKRTPKPNETTNVLEALRPELVYTFDSIGRLEEITNSVNSASTRFEYPSTNRIDSFITIEAGEGETQSFQITDGFGRIVATAKDHTPTTFSAQRIVYDVMGRVIKSSNPTETAAGTHPPQWTTAGDDAAAGWIYVDQTYDWKGRPLVTTNQDGTTKSASYAGCGCAGGEVVTLTDEGGISGGVAKRRQRKIYSDVLGRVLKTEVLNWDGAGPNGTGGSVYSTTVNTYNVRDQVTLVRQYVGTEGSGTFQDTTITYDGYARLKTKHRPEQQVDPNNTASTDHSTWDYNDDDTIQKITDARGASQTFSYNNRHLATGITYSAPAGITIPAAVSIGYDATGNKTSMVDGSKSCSYIYNQLSLMTSETHTFNGLAGNYTLSYNYTLSGALKSVTDHTNQTVNYGYDDAGRVNTVTGTNYVVSQFINNISYRASGAPKQISYGNGRNASWTYNQRLQATHFEIPTATFGPVFSIDYQYYDDGRIKYSQDLLNGKYDRSYEYDHAGRIIRALSGAEARGGPTTQDRPYKETFNYDAFNHLTTRTTSNWSKVPGFFSSDSYSNNRRIGWGYDADGNLTSNVRQYTYDAAGNLRFISGGNTNQFFDGNNQRVKVTEPNIVTYYLQSAVLGQVIAELDGTGTKLFGFIYLGSKLLGRQGQNGSIVFEHDDPSRTKLRYTNAQSPNQTAGAAELDPMGADVYLSDPYISDPQFGGRGEGIGSMGNVGQPSTGCVVDGLYTPCDMANRMLTQGAAVDAPTKLTKYNYETHQFEFYRAYADGHAGYLPADAVYQGGGEATQFVQYGYSSFKDPVTGAVTGSWHPLFNTYQLDPQDPVPSGHPTPTPTPVTQGDVDLSEQQRKIVTVIATRIRELLKNDACRELIQGILDDSDFRIRQAVPELNRLENNRGITYFHGIEFNEGSGPAIAAVRGTYTGFGRSSPRIVLGYYYFENDVGPPKEGLVQYWNISTDEARVLALFHELKHHLTRQPDKSMAEADAESQKILDTCMGLKRSPAVKR